MTVRTSIGAAALLSMCLKNRQDRGSFLAPLEAGNSSRALGLLHNLPKGVK